MRRSKNTLLAVFVIIFFSCTMQDTKETGVFFKLEDGLNAFAQIEFYNLGQKVSMEEDYGQITGILCRFVGKVTNEGNAILTSLEIRFVEKESQKEPYDKVQDGYIKSLYEVEIDLESDRGMDNVWTFAKTAPVPVGVLKKAKNFESSISYFKGTPKENPKREVVPKDFVLPEPSK